jgi:hypothetical protein
MLSLSVASSRTREVLKKNSREFLAELRNLCNSGFDIMYQLCSLVINPEQHL